MTKLDIILFIFSLCMLVFAIWVKPTEQNN